MAFGSYAPAATASSYQRSHCSTGLAKTSATSRPADSYSVRRSAIPIAPASRVLRSGYDACAPHVRPQHFRNRHRAVGLAMGLDDGRPHSRHRERGAVQCVGNLGSLALARPVTDVRPTSLVVTEPTHRADFDPHRAAGRIDLDVDASVVALTQVAGADLDHSVREPERGDCALGADHELVEERRSLLRCRYRADLDLVELVVAEHAPRITPGGPGLAPEAGRVGHEAQREAGLFEDLVARHRRERSLGRRDGPEIVAFEVIGVVGELG